jgi:hypothetical protein
MRRFKLVRDHDVTGVSGTGIVVLGAQFPSGKVVLQWQGEHPSLVIWDSIEDAMAIHGHDGATRLVWIDEQTTIL